MPPNLTGRPDSLLRQLPDIIPGLLWHYTNVAGLHGILTSGALRFSGARFLNDQTEHQYGWDLINAALDHEIARTDQLSRFFESMKQNHDSA